MLKNIINSESQIAVCGYRKIYDKKQMLQHMLGHQNYRLLGDKYDLKESFKLVSLSIVAYAVDPLWLELLWQQHEKMI